MRPIKKLDTKLANQIAAGEVVERPASVVKELLENSLDAGATIIDIEITSGGCGLIRIRDNGSGIPKEQLTLALSPHATSKISSLEDLEIIGSFGFRGEALSSICSVSRFTLSSRTKNADQGWQAEAEGRDMQVKLTPVPITEGTRIDVRELFFNTPARRRFLRTEKTEYSHIEEVVKKVALSNFKAAITLKHNGRLSRRFRAADNLEQQEQRVAAVCGRQFMLRSIRLDLDHLGIELKGWLALPDYHRSQTDGQYFYVNNRPVKDRVLSHAIRQAYQQFIPEGRVPAYVLYLTLDPRKVDVNVHPTKHEVRFHDGRLIHDLLVQAIERGLAEGKALLDTGFLIANKKMPVKEVREDNYASSDIQQHQAYRSMLQASNSSATYQVIKESEKAQVPIIQGWCALTRLSNEYLLLEKDDQFILLSVPTLLKQTMRQHKKTDSVEVHNLLFPEIIKCSNTEDAISVSNMLNQFEIYSNISECQFTIERMPKWMNELPIKILCSELTRAFLNNNQQIIPSPSQQESSQFLLELLLQQDDLTTLQLKKISKNAFFGLFQ